MTGRLEHASPLATASVALALVGILGAGCGSSSTAHPPASTSRTGAPPTPASALAPTHGAYSPKIDPANFVATVDNRYFPLLPGTAFHYEGVAENGKTPQTGDIVVTRRTKTILGVRCTVVRDAVSARGKAVEHTLDWYAPRTREGTSGTWARTPVSFATGAFVKADDSWEAGVAGAKPGIIMPGDPQPGDSYRQEYYPGFALDQARVLGAGGSVMVPNGSYAETLLTEETAPKVDPGVAERKWYVSGVGDVNEHTVSGNHERSCSSA